MLVASPLASCVPSSRDPGGSCASEARAGLVPYKTSAQGLLVNLAPSALADRRVKRLKRSVWASGHLHALAENGLESAVPWFVTLTYRGVDDWRAQHVSAAVKGFRNWCRSREADCRYTWVAELQRRGAVHYHLLAWLPVGVQMPHWDRPTRKHRGMRAAFWPHGMTETDRARSGVGYLMKYLSKLGELTRFPKNLRLYGIGGLTPEGALVRAWFNLPAWAKAAYGVGDLKRTPAGLVVRETGELLPPVWKVSRAPSGLALEKLREVPSRFDEGMIPEGQFPGAYSSFPRAAA